MKSLKQIIIVGCCVFLTTVYAAEQSETSLETYLDVKDASPQFVKAWDIAQGKEVDEDVLKLAEKIKKILGCVDCSISEKKLLISLLNNPQVNLLHAGVFNNDDLQKYRSIYWSCDVGDVHACQVRLTKVTLRKMLRDAIDKNRKELVELLIDAGVKFYAGDVALKLAEEKGDAELVEMLKKAGAQ